MTQDRHTQDKHTQDKHTQESHHAQAGTAYHHLLTLFFLLSLTLAHHLRHSLNRATWLLLAILLTLGTHPSRQGPCVPPKTSYSHWIQSGKTRKKCCISTPPAKHCVTIYASTIWTPRRYSAFSGNTNTYCLSSTRNIIRQPGLSWQRTVWIQITTAIRYRFRPHSIKLHSIVCTELMSSLLFYRQSRQHTLNLECQMQNQTIIRFTQVQVSQFADAIQPVHQRVTMHV